MARDPEIGWKAEVSDARRDRRLAWLASVEAVLAAAAALLDEADAAGADTATIRAGIVAARNAIAVAEPSFARYADLPARPVNRL